MSISKLRTSGVVFHLLEVLSVYKYWNDGNVLFILYIVCFGIAPPDLIVRSNEVLYLMIFLKFRLLCYGW